jgi:hypothetical protein
MPTFAMAGCNVRRVGTTNGVGQKRRRENTTSGEKVDAGCGMRVDCWWIIAARQANAKEV